MNEKLSKILEEARRNPEIKSKFLETRKAQDPMEEFCKVATAIGYDMTVGELFAMGEEYSDNIEQQNNSKTAIASGELVGKKLSGDDSVTSVNQGNFVSENQTVNIVTDGLFLADEFSVDHVWI